MSWLSDILSGDGEAQTGRSEPAERILQLRRGISAAAAALPPEHAELGDAAVAAADALADRVAELVETPAPGAEVEVETPAEDVDAAGWLRAGPARRREAGGPAGSEIADAGSVPDDVAEEGAEVLSELHFSLLRMEIMGADRGSVAVEETIETARSLAERLPAPGSDGGHARRNGGGDGS